MRDGPHQVELIRRHAGNPILTPEDFPGRVNAVFNPAAAVVDGQTLLLVRTEHHDGISSLAVATSPDGLTNWKVDPGRGLVPLRDTHEEHFGVEDPRITQVGDEYYVVYTGFSADGPLVCVARTRDFADWERLGVALRPDDKDAALFPVRFGDRVGDRWAMLHRPGTAGGAHIWLSYSPDLKHWGDPRVVLSARKGGWWDNYKVGLGPQPLLTKDGWLMCYHGVRKTAGGLIYRAGLALLDRDDPAKVLARGDEWVLSPREPYERHGDVGQVVFPCGWLLRDDGDTIHLYYGAADTVVAVAQASLNALLGYLSR
jgi:predicted GH43/DUF377 family glycosyl hydrolase